MVMGDGGWGMGDGGNADEVDGVERKRCGTRARRYL